MYHKMLLQLDISNENEATFELYANYKILL
jgi:hypothetical protein